MSLSRTKNAEDRLVLIQIFGFLQKYWVRILKESKQSVRTSLLTFPFFHQKVYKNNIIFVFWKLEWFYGNKLKNNSLNDLFKQSTSISTDFVNILNMTKRIADIISNT